MKVCMAVAIINMCEMQFTKASSMYSSGTAAIALGTPARAPRPDVNGIGCIASCSALFALEGWKELGWTGCLACFLDCELPMISGPRGRGCTHRLWRHQANVDFQDAFGCQRTRVARVLDLACQAGNSWSSCLVYITWQCQVI